MRLRERYRRVKGWVLGRDRASVSGWFWEGLKRVHPRTIMMIFCMGMFATIPYLRASGIEQTSVTLENVVPFYRWWMFVAGFGVSAVLFGHRLQAHHYTYAFITPLLYASSVVYQTILHTVSMRGLQVGLMAFTLVMLGLISVRSRFEMDRMAGEMLQQAVRLDELERGKNG